MFVQLRMGSRDKFTLIILFAAGNFTVACSIIRMLQIKQVQKDGNNSMLLLWGAIEMNIGVSCFSNSQMLRMKKKADMTMTRLSLPVSLRSSRFSRWVPRTRDLARLPLASAAQTNSMSYLLLMVLEKTRTPPQFLEKSHMIWLLKRERYGRRYKWSLVPRAELPRKHRRLETTLVGSSSSRASVCSRRWV